MTKKFAVCSWRACEIWRLKGSWRSSRLGRRRRRGCGVGERPRLRCRVGRQRSALRGDKLRPAAAVSGGEYGSGQPAMGHTHPRAQRHLPSCSWGAWPPSPRARQEGAAMEQGCDTRSVHLREGLWLIVSL